MSASQLISTLAHEEQKLLACIHCGLCLEACPTYVLTGDENDGPRGRLYLMRAVGEGRLATSSQSFERHIDRCLGCRACEQVCPAGVEYGQLLEAARGELFTAKAQKRIGYQCLRLVLRHVWLYPRRLKLAFSIARAFQKAGLARLLLKSGIARGFSKRIEFGLALLESSAGTVFNDAAVQSRDTNRGASPENQTLLFSGCVGAGLFARVNEATRRVLEVNGFNVSVPAKQVCCGALHAHAGDLDGARTLARQNIQAFSSAGETPIITNAGGCGAMLASYGHLLEHDESVAGQAREFSARVRDVSQYLEIVPLRTGVEVTEQAVTYDASCHLLYGQHAGEAPLKIVGGVSGLHFTRLEGSERCCGGAGIYNLLEPEMSRAVLEEKLENIQQTGASILATGNPGCQMQIGAGAMLAGMKLTVCHPVELLDASYRKAGFYDALEK